MNFSHFIQYVNEKINSEHLPGQEAQKRVIPEGRALISENHTLTDAAVLLLITPMNKKPSLIFIKRTENKGAHSGQISFPGGKKEQSDESMKETALRETEEEIGINRTDINILGKLTPLEIDVSRFRVHPFVGYTSQSPQFIPQLSEVQYIIIEEIDTLLLTKVMSTTLTIMNNKKINTPYISLRSEILWGATLMILNEFLELIREYFNNSER